MKFFGRVFQLTPTHNPLVFKKVCNMKPWYSFSNLEGANNKPAELVIYDEIGFWGVTHQGFKDAMRSVKSDKLKVSINSNGGDVFAGLGIHNELQAFKDGGKKTVDVTVMGIAASIASVIAMAGDTIEMPKNSFMMVHNPWTFAMGNADELRETADVLDKLGGSITGVYVDRTGKTKEEVEALLKADTYMTAEEAVALGFATSVTEEIKASAKFDISDMPVNVQAIFRAAPKPTPPNPVDAPRDVLVNVDQITAAVTAAGLGEFSASFVLDETIVNQGALDDSIASAKAIKAYCDVAKKPELAAAYIKTREKPAAVRSALLKVLNDADEQIVINNTPPKKPTPQAAAGPEPTLTSIWDKRHAQTNPASARKDK